MFGGTMGDQSMIRRRSDSDGAAETSNKKIKEQQNIGGMRTTPHPQNSTGSG